MIDRNHYSVLGVRRTDGPTEIRDAYVRRLKDTHPDLHHPTVYPKARLEDLQRAYHCLRDEVTRSAYDAELRAAEEAHHARLRRKQRRVLAKDVRPAKAMHAVRSRSVDANRSRWWRILLIAVMVLIGVELAKRR